MKELIGHKIVKVLVETNCQALRFEIKNREPIIYYTQADCCSETWFAEILNLDFLIGHTVSEVETLQMPEFIDGNCRQEEDRFYGYRLATEAGHTTITFRNSSNGWYGGSITTDPRGCDVKLDDDPEWQDISHLSEWTAYQNTKGSYLTFLKFKAFW